MALLGEGVEDSLELENESLIYLLSIFYKETKWGDPQLTASTNTLKTYPEHPTQTFQTWFTTDRLVGQT